MADYSPLFYPELNNYVSMHTPAGVHTTNDATTVYYQRMLYQRAMSVFEWEIPENWDLPYLQWVLSTTGYAIVLDTDQHTTDPSRKFGIIPQWGTLYGYGIYYQPTKATVANPLVHAQGLQIGQDCELIRLTPDYSGLWDIIQTYAELLSLAATATSMSLINSRVAFAIAAKNKSAANTIKAIYNKVRMGEPAVVYDGSFIQDANSADPQPWSAFTQDVKNNYIADQTLEAFNTILAQYDEEVGIPSLRGAVGNKKERVTNEEVHRNDAAVTARCSIWLDTLTRSIDKVNNMFGLTVSVKLREGGRGQCWRN